MTEAIKITAWRWWHYAIIASAILLAIVRAHLLAPWYDEVAYVDPGAQLALTGRMVSTAWVTNSPETLWGSSNPGMPLLFAAWFKLLGFGQAQARLLFCLLHFAGVFFLFRWIRTRFHPSPWALVLGIVASVLLPSLANAIFKARLECLAFLFCAWFLHYAYDEVPGAFWFWFAPPILGLAIIFFGLHFAGFFALAAITAFVISPGRRTFLQGAGLALGLAAGLVILWGAYSRFGVWDVFLTARASHYRGVLDWVPLGWNRFGVQRDLYIFAALICIGLLSAARASGWKPARAWTIWLWAIAAFFMPPLFISLVGIYHGSYSWMVALPVMLCFYIGEKNLNGMWRIAFVSILSIGIFSAAFKFALHLPGVAQDAGRREQVTASLEGILPKGNAIAADFPLYYQLAGAGYRVFLQVRTHEGICLGFDQEHYLPKSVRSQIGCVVMKQAGALPALSGLGGEWRMVAEIAAVPGQSSEENYQIYVRK
jgi:hypothetical protein